MTELSYGDILQAERRIRPFVRETMLEAALLFDETNARVLLKLETLQHTGSFKLRGAMNKLLSLSTNERARGVVTASTGNHGAAVAYGLAKLGLKGSVFVPETTSASKLAAMARYGIELRQVGDDGVIAEAAARQHAAEQGLCYISPYNDLTVIAGQGTVGVELARQLEHIDAVFIALGGGGLLSGTACYLKQVFPNCRIIACSPENSAVMLASLEAGSIRDMPSRPTLSDGTAGGVEKDAVTFALCQRYIDESVTVSERDIARALCWSIDRQHHLIEGAAAVVLAAFDKLKKRFAGQTVVLVMCGANISSQDLARAIKMAQ